MKDEKISTDQKTSTDRKSSAERRTITLKDRFNYWFDNKMTRGSLGFIRILIILTVLLAVLIAGLIILFRFNEKGEIASVFWDSIATVINAWMPSFEDGSPGYLVLMSITAIAGLLFTSVLIGIITSAIEEKIDSLKRGNSLVLEKGHIVVLGFYPGEYTLLQQLILAAAGKPSCVVVAEDLEREDMEQDISENLDIPKNFRIICRTVDITDPASIEKCSVDTCKTVIISPADDLRTIKAVLAISALLEEEDSEVSVNAIILKNDFRFPSSIDAANHIMTLQTNILLAKMIAHSCTQTGLSMAFKEIIDFEGLEFYLIPVRGIDGISFEDLMVRMDDGTPAGVYRDGKMMMNPPSGLLLKEEDRILVFAEDRDSARLEKKAVPLQISDDSLPAMDEESTSAVIIGHNQTLPIILRELPENVSCVYLVDQKTTQEEREELWKVAEKRNLQISYYQGDPRSESFLLELAGMAEHFVVLNDYSQDPEEADMEAIFLLLFLRDIRKKHSLNFNITVEMQKEHNQRLVGRGDHTDFLVASSMSSLILAQLAENPELADVFQELLSNEGNELYLKNVHQMHLEGKHTIRELRLIMLKRGYILLGDLDSEKYCTFTRKLNDEVVLSAEDCLIVIGEN